jgi:hypothetical protein
VKITGVAEKHLLDKIVCWQRLRQFPVGGVVIQSPEETRLMANFSAPFTTISELSPETSGGLPLPKRKTGTLWMFSSFTIGRIVLIFRPTEA